jgi:hypothetical protein
VDQVSCAELVDVCQSKTAIGAASFASASLSAHPLLARKPGQPCAVTSRSAAFASSATLLTPG